MEGAWTITATDGKVVGSGEMTHGAGAWTSLYPTGAKLAEGRYRVRHGRLGHRHLEAPRCAGRPERDLAHRDADPARRRGHHDGWRRGSTSSRGRAGCTTRSTKPSSAVQAAFGRETMFDADGHQLAHGEDGEWTESDCGWSHVRKDIAHEGDVDDVHRMAAHRWRLHAGVRDDGGPDTWHWYDGDPERSDAPH